MSKMKIRWMDGAARGTNDVASATLEVSGVRVEDSVVIFTLGQGRPVLAVPASRLLGAVEVTE